MSRKRANQGQPQPEPVPEPEPETAPEPQPMTGTGNDSDPAVNFTPPAPENPPDGALREAFLHAEGQTEQIERMREAQSDRQKPPGPHEVNVRHGGEERGPLSGLTEGRIVHYVVALNADLIVHRPAVITAVKDPKRGVADLSYFTALSDWPARSFPGPLVALSDVPYSDTDTTKVGTWHFPERV